MTVNTNAMHLQKPMEAMDLRRAEDVVAESAARRARLECIYVLNNLAIGGSERKTVRVANALAARGVRLGIVCLNRPDTLLSALDKRIEVHFLDRKGKFSPLTIWRLRRIFMEAKPKAVVSVNPYPALYVAAAAALMGKARPRTVCMINTSVAGISRAWERPLYKAVLGVMDRTVHGCEAYRKTWCDPRSRAWGRSETLYNGVDPEEFFPPTSADVQKNARELFGIPADRFVIGTVGRLVPGKNQAVLIEAMVRLRWLGLNTQLLIVGDGPVRATLSRKAVQLGVGSRVTFTGSLSDVKPALEAMDVFVLPSCGVETFSNAALEAMSMGRPVILTDIGGSAEMLTNGVEGFIVPPLELSARLPALLTQLYSDRRRLNAMGAAARARAVSQFSLSAMVDNHQALVR